MPKHKMINDFTVFERMYESRIFEGLIDKFESDLNRSYADGMSELRPLLKEYDTIKKTFIQKRVKLNTDIINSEKSEVKEKLNNDLVRVNKDEKTKLETNAKKIAKWTTDQQGILKTYMRGRMRQTDMETIEQEYNKVKVSSTQEAKKRYEDLIDIAKEELAAYVKKIEALLVDEKSDTKKSDDELEKISKKKSDTESDYDASGDVSADEKTVKRQKEKDAERDPLNMI